MFAAVAFVGCDVERDLDETRFTCDRGGPCNRDGGVPDASSPPPTCDRNFGSNDACGGDLVGTWNIIESCGPGYFESELQKFCPVARLTMAEASAGGRITFNADTTYETLLVLTLDGQFRIAPACHTAVECSQYGQLIQLKHGGAVTCTGGTADPCDCSYVGPFLDDLDGSWFAASNTVTVENGTEQLVAPYCVDQNRLTFSLAGTTFIAERL